MKERHNHIYPHFLIKNWKKDPWSKIRSKRYPYNKKKDMGQKGYYPEKLETDLSKVESDIARIIEKIKHNKIELDDTEIIKIILYIRIQTVRLDNICEYINNPDYIFPGNNEFLFGVSSTTNKIEVIKQTEHLVKEFLNININKSSMIFSLIGISPIIWKSIDNIFVATDNAVFKEVDIDGKFLFVMMPVSPKIAIVLSKNSYYSSKDNLIHTLSKHGDRSLSMSTNDNKLINNYKHTGVVHLPFLDGKPAILPVYEIVEKDIEYIIAAMIQDAKRLIFYDMKDDLFLNYLKKKIPARMIKLSY